MENSIFDEFLQKWTMHPIESMLTHPNSTNISIDLMHSFSNNNMISAVDEVGIADMYGPTRDPLYVVIPITIIYSLIFITGFVGNICTCIVIFKNRNMHTATNYYLFSLAVSDFLLLVTGMPQEMFFIWSKYPYVFGESFCILRGLCAETSTNATVLTITAFTVERYVAICHPFLSHTLSKLSRAVKFIIMVWIVSITFAIPQALQFGVVDGFGGVQQCTVKQTIIHHSFELSTFLFFVAPMTLITILYVLIGLRLRSSTIVKHDSSDGSTASSITYNRNNISIRRQAVNTQGSRRVLKMLVAVVLAFFICWAPFHAQRLVYIYGTNLDHSPSNPTTLIIFTVMTYVSGILYYLSTCINPFLYNIMSHKFREAFKETLGAWCQSKATRQQKEPKRWCDRMFSRCTKYTWCNCGNKQQPESSEFTGNSMRDESLLSSTTKKLSFDSTISVTLKEDCFLPNYKHHTKDNYLSSLRLEERCELEMEIMSTNCDISDNNTEMQLITNSGISTCTIGRNGTLLENNCQQNSNCTMINCMNLSLKPQETTCDTIIINNDISNTKKFTLRVKPQQQHIPKKSIKFKRFTNLFNYIIRHKNDDINNQNSPPSPSLLTSDSSMKRIERKINWNRDSRSIKSSISNGKKKKTLTSNDDDIYYQDDDNEMANSSVRELNQSQGTMKRKILIDKELRQDYFPSTIGETELDLYMRELRKRQFV